MGVKLVTHIGEEQSPRVFENRVSSKDIWA
jgi:hypothetical protein